jgi:hypothetical protein
MRHYLLPVLLAGAFGLALASGGTADAAVRWGKCGPITRVPGKGAVCSNGFTYNFSVGSPAETWIAKLTTPMNQCAPLKFTVELDGKALKPTAALAGGKSATVMLGTDLVAGAHVLVVKTQVMYSECFTEESAQVPGNWGVDTLISVQPK